MVYQQEQAAKFTIHRMGRFYKYILQKVRKKKHADESINLIEPYLVLQVACLQQHWQIKINNIWKFNFTAIIDER